ncbi:MAG TPA: site-specific integrase [Nitrospiraceae bacterium]|nr:site-specific integrase [Nitrospiraceae bacterium]
MALYKRGEVWWMRFSYQGKQVRRSTEVTDKKLAKRIYDKVLGQIAEGKWFERTVGEDKTVKQLLERYLTDHSARNKASMTYRRDKSLANHLLASFGDLTLVQVRPAFLAEYKARRRKEEASPKTINSELTLLSHAFELAMKEWEWANHNPVKKVSREKVHNLIERWLTPEEEKRLLEASPTWLREIILFAIHTGLRQSEILNLQWDRVDLFRRTITLLEQKNRCKDTLPVNATALEILKARARVRSASTEYVFHNEAHHRRDARDLLRAFYPAMKKAKIERFRFHDLRHTFATRLVQAGVDLYTVQKLGRWKTISMVMRYAHHHPESLRAGIEVLDQDRMGPSTKLAQTAGSPGVEGSATC